MRTSEINIRSLLIVIVVCLGIWYSPIPEGVRPEAWHLFAIFLSSILAIILKAAPMGTVGATAIAVVATTRVLSPDPGKAASLALGSFGDRVIWLIGISFLIARGFIKTGLGERVSYYFIKLFGKSSLGLAYGLTLADFVLAPAIPSNTARVGGIINPILKSMAASFGSVPEDPATHRRLGAYLTLCAYNINLITSAMFLTGTAINPMSQKLAQDLGVRITWMSWAAASIVPGLICVVAVPWVLWKIYAPEVQDTPEAPQIAEEKLAKMGPMKRQEWLMVGVFFILLILWMTGDVLGVDATAAAFLGLAMLLLTQVLTWEDVKSEKGAWDTVFWFSAFVMMASSLNTLGLIPWFSDNFKGLVANLDWTVAFPVIIVAYFYSHYFFASATAHIAAMFTALLSVGISVGVPPMLLALMLGFTGSLYGTLTHYGHGPAPVLYGSGFVDVKSWWSRGFVLSLLYLGVWLGIGGLWWKVLGIW